MEPWTVSRFRLLDTDSGILIQIRFYFVLHLMQIKASWYRFGHSKYPYADIESSNLIQWHAIWYIFVFILCYIWYRIMQSDTRTCNLIQFSFYSVLHLIQIQASWCRFRHSKYPYANIESSNLIQGHAIWYRFVFILCYIWYRIMEYDPRICSLIRIIQRMKRKVGKMEDKSDKWKTISWLEFPFIPNGWKTTWAEEIICV